MKLKVLHNDPTDILMLIQNRCETKCDPIVGFKFHVTIIFSSKIAI